MHSTRFPTARDAARRYVFTRGLFAPYFVFEQGAPPGAPLHMVIAASAREAVDEALPREKVLCDAALPLPDAPDAPETADQVADAWRVVCLEDGRGLLIGRGGWPTPEDVSHAALWASLEADVRARIEAHWATFRTVGTWGPAGRDTA